MERDVDAATSAALLDVEPSLNSALVDRVVARPETCAAFCAPLTTPHRARARARNGAR